MPDRCSPTARPGRAPHHHKQHCLGKQLWQDWEDCRFLNASGSDGLPNDEPVGSYPVGISNRTTAARRRVVIAFQLWQLGASTWRWGHNHGTLPPNSNYDHVDGTTSNQFRGANQKWWCSRGWPRYPSLWTPRLWPATSRPAVLPMPSLDGEPGARAKVI